MTARRAPTWVSPSLAAVPDGSIPAFEMKFQLPEPEAARVEAWAAANLTLDPHADPALGNRYRVTTVYLDTPGFHVFRKEGVFAVHKHRVRRYGTEPVVHVERKSKRDGRVWKCRGLVPADRLEQLAHEHHIGWFSTEVTESGLRPVCRASYDRAAYVGNVPTGPVRVTFDRAAFGVPATDLDVTPVRDGQSLLGGDVVIEFKFLAALPAVFKAAITEFKLIPGGMSKYRRCVTAAGVMVA